MSKPKLTEWYPPRIKPLANRPGTYNASTNSCDDVLRHWDGKSWSLSWYAQWADYLIELRKNTKTTQRGIFWRGLATEPTK